MNAIKSATPLSFSPEIAARLDTVLENPPPHSFAIFDWDHTCVFGDCQDTVFRYQLSTLSFRAIPTLSGHQDFLELEDAFRALSSRTLELKKTHSISERSLHPTHQDFVGLGIKLNELYLAHPDLGPKFAYIWILKWLTGFSEIEISEIAKRALSEGLRTPIHEKIFGANPPFQISVSVGLRPQPEIQWLFQRLKSLGIDIYVVTASLERVVQEIASMPLYGLARDHIKGMRFPLPPESLLTWRAGKVEMIQKEIHPTHSPLLVMGDSDGDYEMLLQWPECPLKIILEKSNRGDIGKLIRDPRYLVQKRNLKTGEWCR